MFMQSLMIIGLLGLYEKILKVFFIYGRGGHLGHVTRTIYINFLSPFPRRLHINLALIGQAVLQKKIFENGGHIHVYSPKAGGEFSPGVQSFHLHIFTVN